MGEKRCQCLSRTTKSTVHKSEIVDNGAKWSLAPNLTNIRRWAKQEKGRNNCIH